MNRLLCVFLGMVLLSSGCTSQWAMKTDSSGTQFLWPTLPEKPRIKYLMSVTGFEESTASLKSFFLGKLNSSLARPVAAAVSGDGRIAIADTGSQCVHLYIPSEKRYVAITTAASESLQSPVGLAFDEESRLYVSDSALAKVAVYDKNGTYIFSFGEHEFKRPTGLAYNKDKKMLYVVDTLGCKVFGVTRDGKVLFSFGGRGVAAGRFNFPTHVFWSPAGLVYVTDSLNFRVQIFNDSGNFRTSFGHHGDGSGDFAMPKGIAADNEGTIYVIDTLFDNVQLFNERGEFLLTIGRRGYDQGEFWLPGGIFIEDNKIYISDTYNQRVQVFDILLKEFE